jgi:hypothetical protein
MFFAFDARTTLVFVFGGFGLVAALATTLAICYNIGYSYCLGADIAWIQQALQRSLPALGLGSSSPAHIALSRSIAT